MRKLLTVILVLLVSTIHIWAASETTESIFEKGNAFYKEGKYTEAITEYETILGQGYISDNVFYNLGNSYYKTKGITKAILYYEKTLKTNPSHEDAKHNLDLCNKLIVDKVEPLPILFYQNWIKATGSSLSLNGWAYWTWGCSALLAISLTLFFLLGNASLKKLFFGISILVLLLGIFGFMFLKVAHKQYSTPYSIVFAESISIKSEPSENATNLFVLHEGTKVQIFEKQDNWSLIGISDGNKGWIPTSELAEI